MSYFKQTVRDTFGLRAVAGEVGLELELEGQRFPVDLTKWWGAKGDGSLRGDGIEYVLSRAILRKDVGEALKYLQQALKDAGTKLAISDRCGTHVHINVQDFTLLETINYITLYTILEDLLVKFCGEAREGNLFCLRMKDAENLLDTLVSAIERENLGEFRRDHYKYAALNLCALGKFGSLEFRAMRADRDFSVIETWTNMLLNIKDASKQFNDAKEIVTNVSANGADFFLRHVMGQYAELIECPEMNDLILQGTRRAQLVAFAEPKAQGADQKKKREGQRLMADPDFAQPDDAPEEEERAEEEPWLNQIQRFWRQYEERNRRIR